MKIKNLKFFLSASILVCFTSIFLLSCVGCGGIKQSDNSINEKESKDIKNAVVGEKQENESLPNDKQSVSNNLSQKIPSFKKIVNGEEVIVSLTGNYHKTLKFPNKEYPLEVKEVYPGIVTYDKYDSIKIIPYHQEDSIRIFNRVVDEIEFYENGKFLSSYDVDQNNPYLKGREGIKIMNHYSDAEGTEVLINREKGEKYLIDTYHLRQNVSNHGPYTSINYWKNEISQGWIVNSITTIVVSDSTGNVIFSEEYDRMMSPPAISPNGKYLMVGFSGVETVNNAGVKFQSDGFELWQIKPKKNLYVKTNSESNYWIGNPTYSTINNALGISFSNSSSNNPKFRENPNNISSVNFHFRMEDEKLYMYEIPISLVIRNEEYFKKNKRYKTWESVSKELNFKKQNLNRGK